MWIWEHNNVTFVELVSYCAWYCNLKMNRCVLVCYIVTVPTFFFESLFIEMQMLTHNHCDRPSLRKTQGSFLKHLWKGLKLHHDCKMAPREHGHQHCCTRSIAIATPNWRMQWARQRSCSLTFTRKGNLVRGLVRSFWTWWGIGSSIPRISQRNNCAPAQATRAAVCRNRKCTLTTYGRKGMEIRRWSLLCSITWSCSGKKCGIQNGSTSSTLQFGPFSWKKCGIQNGSTISTIHFGPFSMQQAIV